MTRVFVLSGAGLNCENETAHAFEKAGGTSSILPVADLIRRPSALSEVDILALPGGFSFGDEIQSGHILGSLLASSLSSELQVFLSEKKLIIGICNGFQVLMKMGLFEARGTSRQIALTHNKPAGFKNQWVSMDFQDSVCKWTQGLEAQVMHMPMRHGEGRIWAHHPSSIDKLFDQKQVVATYQSDVNGSARRIAGLTDPTGQVFGLMPHPEAAINPALFPEELGSGSSSELNLQIFKNGILYSQKRRS